MKNKICTLALTLGFFTQSSYAMEFLVSPCDIDYNKYLSCHFSRFSSPQERSRFDFINILHNEDLKNKNLEKAKDQIHYLESLPEDTTTIDKIDASIDPLVHKQLSKFGKNNKVMVTEFTDYLGRTYNNICLPAVNSRMGNIGFMSQYYNDEKRLKKSGFIFSQYFFVPYRDFFKLNNKLTNDEDQLKFKTLVIHFIEDVILPQVQSQFGPDYFDGYNRLILLLMSLPNLRGCIDEKNNNGEHPICVAWQNYLKKVSPDQIIVNQFKLDDSFAKKFKKITYFELDQKRKKPIKSNINKGAKI